MAGVDAGGEVEIFGDAPLQRRTDDLRHRAVDLVILAGIGIQHEGRDLHLDERDHLIAHGDEIRDLQQLLRDPRDLGVARAGDLGSATAATRIAAGRNRRRMVRLLIRPPRR